MSETQTLYSDLWGVGSKSKLRSALSDRMSETPHPRMRRGVCFFLTSLFIEPAAYVSMPPPVTTKCELSVRGSNNRQCSCKRESYGRMS